MPMYSWKEMKTGKLVEVLRSFADYQIPPKEEEMPEELRESLAGESPTWERQIGRDIRVTKGANWGGGKGYW